MLIKIITRHLRNKFNKACTINRSCSTCINSYGLHCGLVVYRSNKNGYDSCVRLHDTTFKLNEYNDCGYYRRFNKVTGYDFKVNNAIYKFGWFSSTIPPNNDFDMARWLIEKSNLPWLNNVTN
jgi:hypothetical protein